MPVFVWFCQVFCIANGKNLCIIAHFDDALVPFSLNGREQTFEISTALQMEFKFINLSSKFGKKKN